MVVLVDPVLCSLGKVNHGITKIASCKRNEWLCLSHLAFFFFFIILLVIVLFEHSVVPAHPHRQMFQNAPLQVAVDKARIMQHHTIPRGSSKRRFETTDIHQLNASEIRTRKIFPVERHVMKSIRSLREHGLGVEAGKEETARREGRDAGGAGGEELQVANQL